MKKIGLILIFLMALALCACPAVNDSGVKEINIKNGQGTATFDKKATEVVTVAFDNKGYTKLYGTLESADSQANVRFNQIFMPGGEADGPFGREIEYQLTSDGRYQLSIGENMMAGDPWEGKFTVTLKLSK